MSREIQCRGSVAAKTLTVREMSLQAGQVRCIEDEAFQVHPQQTET